MAGLAFPEDERAGFGIAVGKRRMGGYKQGDCRRQTL
jgi:hypothetical protein